MWDAPEAEKDEKSLNEQIGDSLGLITKVTLDAITVPVALTGMLGGRLLGALGITKKWDPAADIEEDNNE